MPHSSLLGIVRLEIDGLRPRGFLPAFHVPPTKRSCSKIVNWQSGCTSRYVRAAAMPNKPMVRCQFSSNERSRVIEMTLKVSIPAPTMTMSSISAVPTSVALAML